MTPTRKLIIAGAGTGKTYTLINELINAIPYIRENPTKFCVVITYTNAAVQEIQERLILACGVIPHNIHISTIHSFLIDFILNPFAHIFEITTREKIFIDKINVDGGNFFKNLNSARSVAENAKKQGIITFDKILDICDELTKKEEVCKILGDRISHLFIDEYQDSRIIQHNIIKRIIQENDINLLAIGDPLQSIYSFVYQHSQLSNEPKPNDFNTLPIMELKNSIFIENSYLSVSRRCSHNITKLINNYTKIIDNELYLESTKSCNNIPVYFIYGKDQDELISKYEKVLKKHNKSITSHKNLIHSLILTKGNNDITGIRRLDKQDINYNSKIFYNTCDLVTSCIGLSKNDFLKEMYFDSFYEKNMIFRAFCFFIMSKIMKKEITSIDDIKYNIKKYLKIDVDNKNSLIGVNEKINSIISHFNSSEYNINEKEDHKHSTIHSSKGLEAESVLAIASSYNQITTWLDFDKCIDSGDSTRLGYVAFSRAKELLCIGCLTNTSIPKKIKTKLDSLGIVIEE